MGRIATDFILVVVWPMIAVAVFTLWMSGRRQISDVKALRRSRIYYEGQIRQGAVDDNYQQVIDGYSRAVSGSWRVLIASIAAVCALVCLFLLSDVWKVRVAFYVWSGLVFVSVVAFVAAIFMACRFARRFEWLQVGVCVICAMLIASGGEHCYHQQINSRHATCARCDDDDRPNEL